MKMRGMTAAWCVAVCLGAAVLGTGGCHHRTTIVEGEVYPALKQGETLNIHVLRDGTIITMTNTTTRTFVGTRMWLNQWYSRALPDFGPGKTLTLPLAEFKDRYGDKFKAGGFWAIDNPEGLALAQIEDKGELIGLVVIGQAR